MNIMLVSLRGPREKAFPLGLAHVAASLRRAGHGVLGLDLSFDAARLPGVVADFRPDLVGVTVRCDTWAEVPGVARAVIDAAAAGRGAGAAPAFVFGGPGALTPGPDGPAAAAALAGLGVSAYLVAGDGEAAAVELARALEAGETALPAGVAALVDGQPRPAPAPQLLVDVDHPGADYTLFPLRRYSGRGTLSRRHPYAPLVTSRGCAHDCPFCTAPRLGGGRWRPRSPSAVVEEMGLLAQRFGVRDVHIEDDDFLHDPDRVEELCDRLARRSLDLVFECMNGARPDHLPGRVIRALRRGGCATVTLGIEGLNPAAERALGRPLDEREVRALVSALHAAGLSAGGYFMLGLPGEGLDEARQTVRAALRLDLDLAQFSLFRPLPGSAWEAAPPAGGAGVAGATGADGHANGFDRLRRSAFLRFYLRPRALRAVASRLSRPTVDVVLARIFSVLGGAEDGH